MASRDGDSEIRCPAALRNPWFVVSAIVLLALVLRSVHLRFQPLWWDEGYSIYFATSRLAELLSLTAQDIHPPLYYVLLRGWIGMLGPSAGSVRSLSVVFGAATVPLVYLAGRDLVGTRTGLLAALVLAINPLHIFYSQEVRMYGLVALLSLAITYFSLRLFLDSAPKASAAEGPGQRRSRLWLWAGYALCTVAVLYTQYYAAFVPITLSLVALWRWRRQYRRLLEWLAAQLLVLLAYIPWLLYAAPQLVPYVSQKVVKDADASLGILAYFGRHLSAFVVGHAEGWAAPLWWFGLLVLPLIVWGLWRWSTRPSYGRSQREVRSIVVCLSLLVLVPLALGFVLNLNYPFFPDRGERLMLLAHPPFVLLAALGIGGLWDRARAIAADDYAPLIRALPCAALILVIIASSALSLAAYYATPRYADDDYRELIARVNRQSGDGDSVYCVFPWQVGYFRSYAPDLSDVLLTASPAWGDDVQAQLDDSIDSGDSIWFPAHLALGGVLETAVEGYLLSVGYPLANEWYGSGTRLVAVSGASPSDSAKPSFVFGEKLQLSSAEYGPSKLMAANEVLAAGLEWTSLTSVSGETRVVLRLTDDQGRTWAQRDSEPMGGNGSFADLGPGERLTDRHALLVEVGTPPGRYDLRLAVADSDSERLMEASDREGAFAGSEVVLGTIDVTAADAALPASKLPIADTLDAPIGEDVVLAGYSQGECPFAPGDSVKINLFWRAENDGTEDLVAFVQALDRGGQVIAGWEAPPGGGYATSGWQRGDWLRTQVQLGIPANTEDGGYDLIAGLFRSADGNRLKSGRRDYVDLRSIQVVGRSHTYTAPKVQQQADVSYGGLVTLVGYEVAPSQSGSGLAVALVWRPDALLNASYHVFVHLVDVNGAILAQADGVPGDGTLPTTGWLPGEYLTDLHTVDALDAVGSSRLSLRVGLYEPESSLRLQVLGPDGEGSGDYYTIAVPESSS